MPGPVRNITVVPLSYGVQISWLPPSEPNGVIKKYIVTYTQIVEQTTGKNKTVLVGLDFQYFVILN